MVNYAGDSGRRKSMPSGNCRGISVPGSRARERREETPPARLERCRQSPVGRGPMTPAGTRSARVRPSSEGKRPPSRCSPVAWEATGQRQRPERQRHRGAQKHLECRGRDGQVPSRAVARTDLIRCELRSPSARISFEAQQLLAAHTARASCGRRARCPAGERHR
jgi:hypothetical protein